MKVLVTGSSGFLGQQLVKKLLHEGHEVWALSRHNIQFHHPNLNKIVSDVIDINHNVGTLDVDVVFHTAARINFNEGSEAVAQITSDNIMAAFELSDFILKNHINKLIVSSTCSVYEENYNVQNWITELSKLRPLNLYAVSKLSSEWIFENKLKNKVEELIILRYSSIYGSGQRPGSIIPMLIKKASSNETMELFGSGNRIQDYVSIDDVIQANLSCLNRRLPFNSVFNIGSGEQTSDINLAEKIKAIWKSRSKIIIRNIVKSDTFFNYSIEKAKAVLRYRPKGLDEGLNQYFNQNSMN